MRQQARLHPNPAKRALLAAVKTIRIRFANSKASVRNSSGFIKNAEADFSKIRLSIVPISCIAMEAGCKPPSGSLLVPSATKAVKCARQVLLHQ